MSIERLHELRIIVEHHNKLYYQQDNPEISDAEYDNFFRELLALEEEFPEEFAPDSPTLRVGTVPLSEFQSYNHQYRMFSLANAMTKDEFESFFHTVMNVQITSLATPSVVLEYKFDGLAIELVYKDRILVAASTRGDGDTGELVTENIRTIKCIPLRLPDDAPNDLVVYGEAIMLKHDFTELNVQRKAAGEKEFANPRNAAAGSVRLLDSKQAAGRKLSFYAYSCRTTDQDSPLILMNLHTHRMDYIKEAGFQISPKRKIIHPGNFHEAIEFFETVEHERAQLPFEIDGIVAKVVMDEIRELFGYTERAPKWAIAWKFEAEETKTILMDIECEVGRTGAITPVAVLQPVELSGVTISRASLHNYDYILDNDFRIGDTVIIKRAGDVIPFVVKPVLTERPDDAKSIMEPDTCPVCGTLTERDKTLESEVARVIRCANHACPSRIKSRLKHFVSRQGLDIEGFGEKIVDTLFNMELLGTKLASYEDSLAAIYKLKDHRSALVGLNGFGEKSIDQLLATIETKKISSFSRFIQAFGIKGIGTAFSAKLGKAFMSLDEFISAYVMGGQEYEILEQVKKIRLEMRTTTLERDKLLFGGLGDLFDIDLEGKEENTKIVKKELDEKLSELRNEEPRIAQQLILGVNATDEIVKFLGESRYRRELTNLFETGFDLQNIQEKVILGETPFYGKKILVTGKLEMFSTRQMMHAFIEGIGAKVMAGVTSSVDLIIVGEKPGSEKIKKAFELDITMLKESEFYAQLDEVVILRFKEMSPGK